MLVAPSCEAIDVIIADAASAVGGIAAVVAAAAALWTVYYARETVREAHSARREARDDHRELVSLQRAGADAAQAAFREEMSDRRQALDSQIRFERITHATHVGELLVGIVNLAREESQVYGAMPPRPTIPPRIIPAVLTRLGASLTALKALGGPDLSEANTLAETGAGEPAPRVLSGAVNALHELDSLMRNDDRFKLDGD